MANWFYFNKNGEKIGPISVSALKALTQQGLITRETVIANHTGRTAVAGEVRGLAFPEPTSTEPEIVSVDDIEPSSVSPEPDEAVAMQFGNVPVHSIPAPEQTEVYGLSTPKPKPAPPIEANPFTAALPIPESALSFEAPVPVVDNAPVMVANPFTDAPAEESTPFTFDSSVSTNPFVDVPASVDPFTAPAPEAKRTTPGPVIAVNASPSPNNSTSPNGRKKIFIIGGIIAAVLVCSVIGYQRWRSEGERRARESLEQFTREQMQEQKRQQERFVREAMRESDEAMNKILRKGR